MPAPKIRPTPRQSDPHLDRLAAARIAIEGVDPAIDCGRFAAKAIVGVPVEVRADVFSDGHEVICAALLHGRPGETPQRTRMTYLVNDRWTASFTPTEIGRMTYTIEAWRDLFATWSRDTAKKTAAGQDVTLEAEEGRLLVAEALEGDPGKAATAALKALLKGLAKGDTETRIALLQSDDTADLMRRAGPRANLTAHMTEYPLWVDRPAAAFSAWYELFPRSMGKNGAHGTFADVIDRLDYVQDLGFDVLYFPPIHPIGRINRKGRNNTLTPAADDPGSPYAIGSPEGGHMAVHPELGTIEDFDRLVAAAAEKGIEIALDIALNAAPDHPWIKEHPEWFDWRPDGTIKYAENPPKRYEDIVNFHFYRQSLPGLWLAMREMFLFWADHGVKMFRVDNPHTKPLPFWEWLIDEVHGKYPDALFLAEAFTRPKVMKRLGKVGYSQSYSYFTWRNTKAELTEYLTELTTTESRHVMRPNFFITTPDINPVFLQYSGRPGFRTRLVLAATLAGNYGVYNGYEIAEAAAVPGKEEYHDSEKYQIRQWDLDAPGNIKDDIRLMNRLRHAHPALRDFTNLRFYNAWNDQVLYYGRMDEAHDSYLLFHVNLDPHAPQEFAFEVPLWEFGLPDGASIEVADAINGNHFTWHGKEQRLTLDPQTRPYAIWRLFPPGSART